MVWMASAPSIQPPMTFYRLDHYSFFIIRTTFPVARFPFISIVRSLEGINSALRNDGFCLFAFSNPFLYRGAEPATMPLRFRLFLLAGRTLRAFPPQETSRFCRLNHALSCASIQTIRPDDFQRLFHSFYAGCQKRSRLPERTAGWSLLQNSVKCLPSLFLNCAFEKPLIFPMQS